MGDEPGRWVFTHSLYGAAPAQPLAWRPYGCRWRHVSGSALGACVAATGRIKFLGESTLGQAYDFFLSHINMSAHEWPLRLPLDDSRVLRAHPLLRAQGMHGEFHGLAAQLEDDAARKELLSWRPAVVVNMQAANDAARDTFAQYKARLANFTAMLQGVQDGSSGEAALAARLLFITIPVRHYKAGNGPGTAVCAEGTLESCRSVYSGTAYRHVGAEVAWGTHPAQPPLFYGTLDRRRAFNAHMVATVRDAFPGAPVIDFEAMTEALPSDFNMDGEHWGCARACDTCTAGARGCCACGAR